MGFASKIAASQAGRNSTASGGGGQQYNQQRYPPQQARPAGSPFPYPPSSGQYQAYSSAGGAPASYGYSSPPPQGYPPAPYSQGPQGYNRPPPGPPSSQPYGAPGPSYPPQQAPYGQPYPSGPGQAPPPPGPPGGQWGPVGGGPQPGGRATERQVNMYRQLLVDTIQEKQLQAFYPPDKLERIVQGLANDAPTKINKLMREWNVPEEVAMDVIKLTLFDIILYVDDSGSIEFEENGIRKDQLRQILGIVAKAASNFDQDGISVRFMNSAETGDGIRSAEDVDRLVSRVRFSGLTPLGSNLRNKVLTPMVVEPARAKRLEKPVVIITITDGQPAGEPHDTVAQAIRYAVDEVSRTSYGRGAVSFQFSQVGNDTRAREFLARLDEDPQIGSLIDCTSNFEVEQDEMSRANPPVQLTRELWCAKLMLGPIDSSYDTKDEKATAQRRPGGGGSSGPPPFQNQNPYGGGYDSAPGGGGYGGPLGGYQQQQPPPPHFSGPPPSSGYGQPPAPYPTGPGYGQQGYGSQRPGSGGGPPPPGPPPPGHYGQGYGGGYGPPRY